MSWLSKGLRKLGKGAKKLVTHPREALGNIGKDLGKGYEAIDDYALPAIGFALGGPGGAAAGSALARGVGDGRFDPKATALAGVKGYAMGQLGSAAGLQGGQGIRALGASGRGLVANPGMAAQNLVGGGGGGAAASMAPAAGGGGFAGGLRGVGRWALENPEILMGAANTIGGMDAQRKASRNERKMLEQIEREYAERAPLRSMGLRNLQREMTPLDMSVYKNPYNPFSR